MSDNPRLHTDEAIFSVTTLLKYMGNDDKALAIVIKIVRDACAPRRAPLDQAHAAIGAGRLADAGKIFHGLRGSIGTLGAKRFVAASLALEQALVDRDTPRISALLATVDAEYGLVLEHADAWLNQHPAA